MARSPSRKEETHERIVHTAARAIRRHGYAGVGVADVMNEAGLTHGGFYAHFDSKTDMLAEAASRAGAETVEALRRIADAAPAGQALAALIDGYLSQQHADAPESGCPVAALGSEIARQEPAVRAAATRRIKDLIGLVEQQLPGWGKAAAHDKALALVAGMVGSLMLSRAVDDPELSKAIRRAGRQFLRAAATAKP
jgi:AcrR family transcriptional regulator